MIIGTQYHFVSIFDRNKIGKAPFNFYQASLFNCDTGDYVTYTDYDGDPLHPKLQWSDWMLNLQFQSEQGNATWRNVVSLDENIVPFIYDVHLVGKDIMGGSDFSMDLLVNTQKEPTAYGLSTLNGIITFWGQPNTLSYFQTGLEINGTITLLNVTEPVYGTVGHIDRQWFPLYPGIFTPDGREHSHEWRQINLEGAFDLAIWRQFDRTKDNLVINTTGVTTDPPDGPNGHGPGAIYAEDIEVEYISYAKWPRSTFQTLIPPPSQNMWLPSSHILRVPSLDLELTCTYFSPVPAVRMPIEYFEGPASWHGTMNGNAISGTGIFESTLALFHDWELVEVLWNSVSHLPSSSFASGTQDVVDAAVQLITKYIFYGESEEDRKMGLVYINNSVVPLMQNITDPTTQAHIVDILTDLQAAITTNP